MSCDNPLRAPNAPNVPLRLTNTSGQTTDGLLVEVYLIDRDVTPNTKTKVGQGNGAAPGADFTISCDLSAVTGDKTYEVQAAADIGGNPVVVIPNPHTDGDRQYLEVFAMDILS